jgi:hypothetical protein
MQIGNTKVGIKHYWHPTPKIFRAIGDSFLLIGSTITGISAFTMPPVVTAIAAGLTVIGKLLTNFATAIET